MPEDIMYADEYTFMVATWIAAMWFFIILYSFVKGIIKKASEKVNGKKKTVDDGFTQSIELLKWTVFSFNILLLPTCFYMIVIIFFDNYPLTLIELLVGVATFVLYSLYIIFRFKVKKTNYSDELLLKKYRNIKIYTSILMLLFVLVTNLAITK